jgi:hypothetical protein
MKIILVIPLCLLFTSHASSQTAPKESPPQSNEADKGLPLHPPQEGNANLPDMPQPKRQEKKDTDDRYVYYETRVRYRDVDDPVPTWWHALRGPKFLLGVGLLGGLTALQINETSKCKPACSLFFGGNRVAVYAINVPLSAAIVWASGRSIEHESPKHSRAKLMMIVAIWLEATADI